MIRWLRLYPAFILLLFCVNASAQIRCKIRHYGAADGLSHDKITSILKDHDGFMWFGTWDGINRFDGHDFITYKSVAGDKSDLQNNRINQIIEDKSGYLWVRADDKKIYRFNKNTGNFTELTKVIKQVSYKKYLFDNMIACENDLLLLVTQSQGIVAINASNNIPAAYNFDGNSKSNLNLPSNKINFIQEDKQHRIWVGTAKGILFFETTINRRIKIQRLPDTDYDFTGIAENGNLIGFITREGYVITYNKATSRLFKRKILPDNELNAILLSRKNNVIYCTTTSGGLLTLDKTTLNAISTGKADNRAVFSLYENASGLVWIEPELYGIIKYDPVNKTFKHFAQKIYSNFPNGSEYFKVFEDNRGHLWLNMKGGGFGYYDSRQDTVTHFFNDPTADDHLFSNKVNDEYYDPAGVLWLSTEDRGVEKVVYQENDFKEQLLVQHSLIKSDNDIRAVYEDREKRVWIASKRRLHIFKDGKAINNLFVNEPENTIRQIYSMIEDHEGNVWIGTKGDGLFKAEPIDSKRNKYRLINFLPDHNNPNSLTSNIIYSLIEDKFNRLWIGTYGGGLNVAVTNNYHTQFYNAKNGLKNYPKQLYSKIRHLELADNGYLWIASTDGLLILNAQEKEINNFHYSGFKKIPGDKYSLGNNDVQYVYKDGKSRMWLATSGGGINLAMGQDPFRELKFKSYTINDGLANDFTLSCVEDNAGNLWIATLRGLSEFKVSSHQFKNYDSYDGLSASFSEGTCLKLSNGNLMFGENAGYLSFDPSKLTDQRINVKMALTNLQINGKNVSATGSKDSILKNNINHTSQITLKYNQNTLSIDYSVLDFRSDSKPAYAYQLSGVDTGWNRNLMNARKVTYANLAPGTYVFKVKSDNQYLYLNTPLKSLTIKILPPPWRTWWAYLLYVIVAIVVLGFARQIALTMLKLRQNIELEKRLTDLKLSFFTNISHELRTPLSLIINPIDALYKKEKLTAQGAEYVRVVRKNANRMVRFINQLLDLRKVQSGKAVLNLSEINVLDFVTGISEYFTEIARDKNISLNILQPETEIYIWADAEKLDTVIFNILSNAFKFTPQGKSIDILIDQDHSKNILTIKIADQGIGVPQNMLDDIFELYNEGISQPENNVKGTGIGLALSKELIQLHHGEIFASNNPAHGLTITIKLKSGKAHFKDQAINSNNKQESYRLKLELSDTLVVPPLIAEDGKNLYTVLLVEDNVDLRAFLSLQLKQSYNVVEAIDGEDGWQKAVKLIPDLILSDIMMPKMDGIQLLDKLKNNELTSHIPVVLLSARSSIESQIEGLAYGADYYITKPFNNEFLLASVANLIRQRKKIFELLLNGQMQNNAGDETVAITSKDEAFLKEIIKIVENKLADPEFNIDNVADAIGMSRSAFYKKFKSFSDITPVEFIREMRVKRGKNMLDAGEKNISQIAYAFGFSDAKYFGACFKKQFGNTPTDYLKAKNKM